MVVKLEKIGVGATAEIFAWDAGRVLKLFFESAPMDVVQREATITQAVIDSGFPAPRVYDVIEVEGRKGIIYERINGVMLIERLEKEMLGRWDSVREMAELHAELHQCEASDKLPEMYDVLSDRVYSAPHLSEKMVHTLIAHLDRLPRGNRLCHTDFHPLNIIASDEGLRVIDWCDAKSGNPHADVARTLVIMSEHPSRDEVGLVLSLILPFILPRMARVYLEHYCKVTGSNPDDIKAWMPIMAAARLHEPSAKRQQLLKLVREWFRNQMR